MSKRLPIVDPAQRQKALLLIVGAKLTSVQFVLNYLILGFDERGAYTTLVWPELIVANENFVFGMKDYRNQLCNLIGSAVLGAEIDKEEMITVRFDNSVNIQIPLRSYKGDGERGIITGPKHFLFVF